MKKLMILCVSIFAFALTTHAQKKSGAIQFETTTDPAAMASANGIQLSEEMRARMPKAMKTNFELLFNATNASYMVVQEMEDSNGGGGGGMGRMMRFGGGGNSREYYYTFADHHLSEVFDLNDTTYMMAGKLTVAPPQSANFNMNAQRPGNAAAAENTSAVQFLPGPPTMEVVKTDETKNILGFNCNKVIVKSIRKAKVLGMDKDVIDETALWYTTELGFDFSPNPNLWTAGAVLAIENKGSSTYATSIEYRKISPRDVTTPKKAVAITPEAYQEKIEAMMKQRMRSRQGSPGGGIRTTVIN